MLFYFLIGCGLFFFFQAEDGIRVIGVTGVRRVLFRSRPRRRRPAAAPRDPLERPAHGGRMRRDRRAVRPRAADRADGQPSADRLHGAEAALAAEARAGDLRADRPRAPPEGLRT